MPKTASTGTAPATSLMHEIRKVYADKIIFFTILISAFGYFVDIFDLLLFSIVRVDSLKDLGVTGDALLTEGIFLLNVQMAGLLLGGLIWGIMGDKLGRVSVLFGSILLYSIGNIANGFVETINQYAVMRFLTGLGLAGELGVGITLASELLPQRVRGLGTTLIVGIGILGAIAASMVADMTTWRTAYIVGGVMGLVLLAMRVSVRESSMFKNQEEKHKPTDRGSLMLFLRRPDLLKRYLAVVMVGGPIYGVIATFFTFAPEFAKAMGMAALPSAGMAVLYGYAGQAVGDTFSGILSQWLHSRRKSVVFSLCVLMVVLVVFSSVKIETADVYYWFCFALGIGIGFWTMFVQMGAEQFGTNIRATAAVSIPNVVRALTIPITIGFKALIDEVGVVGSGMTVMAVTIGLSFAALYMIRETFYVNLDYVEHRKK